MNERLIAAAACDYEDGAASITQAFAEWAYTEPATDDKERTICEAVIEDCQRIVSDERGGLAWRLQARRHLNGSPHPLLMIARAIIPDRDKAGLFASDIATTAHIVATMMEAMSRGEKPAPPATTRTPHPLQGQLERELIEQGLRVADDGEEALGAVPAAIEGEPRNRWEQSDAALLMQAYLRGQTAPQALTDNRGKQARQRWHCDPDAELRVIARGEMDYAADRRVRAGIAMANVCHGLEVSRREIIGAPAPVPVVFGGRRHRWTERRRSASTQHPLVGPSEMMMEAFLALADSAIRTNYPVRTIAHALRAASVLAHAIRDNPRVCSPPAWGQEPAAGAFAATQ